MNESKERIHAITIDLWNTIMDSGNGAGRHQYRVTAIRDVFQKLHVHRSDDDIGSAIRQIHPIFDRVWKNEHRTLTTAELVSEVWKILGVQIPGEMNSIVVKKFEESILHFAPSLLPDAKKSIEQLAQNYRLALISDTAFSPGYILTQLLESYGIRKYFTTLVFSNETGISKPDPHVFEFALLKLETTSEHAVHIGDIEWTDIKGAKEIGMRAILFRGDRNAISFSEDNSNTIADAVALNWSEALGIIAGWNCVS